MSFKRNSPVLFKADFANLTIEALKSSLGSDFFKKARSPQFFTFYNFYNDRVMVTMKESRVAVFQFYDAEFKVKESESPSCGRV